MELGLRAVLSQEVLEQVRYRTREGMKAVAKHGRVPGGICYGYRVRREFDDSGEPVRGLRSIDTDEAATIVWIFEWYADGMSPLRSLTNSVHAMYPVCAADFAVIEIVAVAF